MGLIGLSELEREKGVERGRGEGRERGEGTTEWE